MSTSTTIPAISFENDLDYDIIIYDSFGDDETDSDDNTDDNYFGTLTSLGTVTARSTSSIQPIHSTSAFIVENKSTQKPVKRCTKMSFQKNITSFVVNQDDEDAMTAVFKFIDFYLKNPNDDMSKAFTAILNEDSSNWFSDIPDFFSKYPAYSKCSFPDYMMGITYNAMNPPPVPSSNPSSPPPPPTYSLKKLTLAMGAQWPEGLPDIAVSNFSCTNKNSNILIVAEIDIAGLCFESDVIARNVTTIMGGDKKFTVAIQFNYAVSLGIFGTRLSFLPENFSIPVGGNNSISVTKPAITFDINPLFKFVLFTLKGTIPFNINNKTFDALVSVAVDNDEASIGVTIEGDHGSLPAPPGLKGLFFDEFGVGIGVFFEPLSCIIGIDGKFHIGSNNSIVSLDDDTFALVCKITGDAITPAFASFYIPKLDLDTVIALFTNVNVHLDVPVSFEDLSFRWVDSLMSGYVMPDGTLSDSGYGFSAACNIGSFGFYGDVELDLNNGLTANVEVSPINWKNVFKLTGDGKGFNIKVDPHGNPIRNNFVPTTQEEKNAVANATEKIITTPGGACLIINTLSMPILHLNAKASLFDLLEYDITADINKDGIKFELDFGAVLMEKMVCNLTDFHNLYAEFGYYIDKSIPLPKMAGVNIGSIPLKADAALHLSVKTSLTDIVISTGGKFDFEDYHFTFGDFTVDISISKITDFLGAVVQYLIAEAESIFSTVIDSAEHWAVAAGKGIVTEFDDAGKVMNNVYKKAKEDVPAILKTAGFAANDIAKSLKNGYSATQKDIAVALKAVGYSADDITKSLRSAFDATTSAVADALKTAAFSISEVAKAIKINWNAAQVDIAWAMMMVGYTQIEVANGLRGAFDATTDSVADAMKKVGYKAEDVAVAIKGAWGALQTDVSWAMMMVGFTETEVANGLRKAFDATTDSVADAMKKIGYKAEDVAIAIKNAWGALQTDVTWAMMMVGFTETDVAKGLRKAFDATTDSVADAMKKIGYKAEDVAKAIRNGWNAEEKDVTWAMMMVGFAANDICKGLQSAFGSGSQAVANAFKIIGIRAQDTANAVKVVLSSTINETAAVLKQAGYAANDVASALGNAFGEGASAVADAMKQVGYAANDVKNAFEEVGGDFKNFAESAWNDVKNAFNPSNW